MSSFPDPDFSGTNRPDFSSKSDEAFEYLCLDVARAHFENVVSGDLHEKRGTAQHGVDFLVDLGTSGLVAGSCRSDRNPAKQRIVGAAKEFAKNWDKKWKRQDVTQFVLCLACEERTETRKKHVEEARSIILDLGITCEVWSQSGLIDRLRPHPAVVVQHLGRRWAHVLCAPSVVGVEGATEAQIDALEAQVRAFEDSRAPLVQAKIDQLIQLARQGAKSELIEEAGRLRKDLSVWRTFNAQQKATVIRTAVMFDFATDIEGFKAAHAEARSLHPPKDRYADFQIIAQENGMKAAVEAISHPRTLRERILKAAYQSELRDPASALKILDDGPEPEGKFTPWYHRVRATALSRLGQDDLAIEQADKAYLAASDDLMARICRAAIYYSATVAPGLGFLGISGPSPYSPLLVRRDAVSQQRRSQAATWFEEVAATAPEKADRELAWLWTFIAALDEPGGPEKAAELVIAAMEDGPCCPSFVTWCLGRQIEFDRVKVEAWLLERLTNDARDLNAAASLFFLWRDSGDVDKLETLFADHLQTFELGDVPQVEAWQQEVERMRSGEIERVDATLEVIEQHFLDQQTEISLRIELAMRLTRENKWDVLFGEREFFEQKVATPVAFEIIAQCIAEIEGPVPALDYYESQSVQYLPEPLPAHYAAKRINFLSNAGKLPEALSYAETIYTDASEPNYMVRARLQFQLGNLRGAGSVVYRALRAGNPIANTAEILMRWANTIASEDPKNAKRFLKASFAFDPDKAVAFGAGILALELMPAQAAPYTRHMQAFVLANPNGPIRSATIEEIRDWMIASADNARRTTAAYVDGRIFGHAVFNERFGLLYFTPSVSNGEFGGLSPQISHAVGGSIGPRDVDEVLMDLSAIFMADILDLWPLLEEAEIDVVLPFAWADSIIDMEMSARPNQPDRVAARERIVEAIKAGEIRVERLRPAGSVRICFEGDVATDSDICEHDLNDERIEKVISDRAPVFLTDGTPEPLEVAGRLDQLLGEVRLSMSERHAQELQREFRSNENGSLVADRMASLRSFLSSELSAGRFRLAPAPSAEAEAEEGNTLDLTVRSGMNYASSRRAAYWCDDRFLNGHSNGPRHPIVGVQVILDMLRERDLITRAQQDDYKFQLRRQGYDFILPTAEEVYAALSVDWNESRQASPRLEAMRRTFERFASIQGTVFGPLGVHAVDERQAAIRQYLLASNVVQLILQNTLGSKDLDLTATIWVMESFRLDWRADVNPEGARQICELWYGSFVLSFLSQAGLVGPERRREFAEILECIYTNLIKPAIEFNSGGLDPFVIGIAEVTAGHINDVLEHDETSNEARVGRGIVACFLEVCPDELEQAICREPRIRDALGVTFGTQVNDLFFLQDDLWTAVDALIDSDDQVTRTIENGLIVVLSRSDETHIQAAVGDRVIERLIPVAIGARDHAIRRAALDERLATFDMCAADATFWRRRFGRARSAEKRAYVLDELSNSPEGRLHQLCELKGGDAVRLDQLAAPGLADMLDWISPDIGLSQGNVSAFEALAEKVGMLEAVRRWSGVPISFPECCEAWFASLGEAEAKSLSERLAGDCFDPVSRRNLLHLFEKNEAAHAARTELVTEAGLEMTENRHAQLDYARAVALRLYASLPPDHSLEEIWISAWAWTGRVFSALIPRGADLTKLSGVFVERSTSNRLALKATLRSNDVLDPNVLTHVQFCSGLGGAWIGEAGEDLPKEEVARVAKEISFQEEAAFPHPAILSLASLPNQFGSWLGDHPDWSMDILSGDDEWMRKVIQERAAFVEDVFGANELKLNQLHMAGIDGLDEAQWARVLRQVRFWIKRFEVRDLQLLASLFQTVPKLDNALSDRVICHYQALFKRAAQLIKDDASQVNELYFFMEVGIRLVSRLKPASVDAMLEMLEVFDGWVWAAHRDEVARFIRLVADTVTVSDRAMMLELAAGSTGAPFP